MEKVKQILEQIEKLTYEVGNELAKQGIQHESFGGSVKRIIRELGELEQLTYEEE